MERSIADLLILQNLCKRDPKSYFPEFSEQHRHFKAAYDLFRLKPAKDHKEFASLVKFLAAVAACYPQELKDFPTQIADLLEQNANVLQPALRVVLVQALILLRNRNLLSPTSLLSLFFKLFRVRDKTLRELLRAHIINDIRRLNSKKKNNELNRTLQNFMYTMLEDDSSIAPRESLTVMIELYRKGVWNDAKTVNVISTGAFHKDSKVIGLTLQFFLVNKKAKVVGQDSDEEEKEEYVPNRREVEHKFGLKNKRKTAARKRKLAKMLKEANHKRKEKLMKETDDEANYNIAAMNLLNDPQGYAEKVLNALRKSNHAFELKIRMMSFISRLIASQKLILSSFYSYMIKYTQPHQQHITQLLSVLAQAIHPLVPPDDIEPVIKHIANTFVTDRRPNEVIAIGLNTIREICLRSPLAMEGNEALLKDLLTYRKFKDKSVMMASRSILTLFRTLNPGLLPRKLRARGVDAEYKPTYGEELTVQTKIDGTELLEKYGDKLDLDDLSEQGSDSMFSSEIEEEDDMDVDDDGDDDDDNEDEDSMEEGSEISEDEGDADGDSGVESGGDDEEDDDEEDDGDDEDDEEAEPEGGDEYEMHSIDEEEEERLADAELPAEMPSVDVDEVDMEEFQKLWAAQEARFKAREEAEAAAKAQKSKPTQPKKIDPKDTNSAKKQIAKNKKRQAAESEESESADEWEEVDLETLRNTKSKSKVQPPPQESSDEEPDEDDVEEPEEDDDDMQAGEEADDSEEGSELGSEEWEEVDSDKLEWESDDGQESDEDDGIDDDDNGDEAPQLIPIDENGEPKKRLETTRILTEEDWEKLRYLRAKEEEKNESLGRKRKLQEMIDRDVDPEDLEGYKKKMKRTLEERVASVKEGRDEHKRKFEYGRKRVGGSRTNKEKVKTKDYSMLRAKAMKKLRRSGGQKLRVKAKHLGKIRSQRMNKHH